ncbi:MAG: dUTP diphosphatase [bacterium]
MILKVKKLHPDAKLPEYARAGDAGMDLFAPEDVVVPKGKTAKIKSGISVEIPEGFVGLFWDKSGLSINHSIKVLGGVLDSGYRGELVVGVINLGDEDYVFEKHHKITQMLVQPVVSAEIVEVDELSESERGKGGLGSTGK